MTTTDPAGEKRRLKAHFGFSHMPFSKYAWATQMYDSTSQRELLQGLLLWSDLHGLALVTGQSGVGKSITLRRFVHTLDQTRYHVIDFSYVPTTVTGFLRSLNRQLGLPMRGHTSDLFDQAQKHLISREAEQGPHPVLLIDDAEGLNVPVLDAVRRLTCYELDSQDRFSILLSAMDDLLPTLRHPALDSLRSRIAYAHGLKPFVLEDTRNYIRFHLERASADPKLFSDDAVRRIFNASAGFPRKINQIATQALIAATIQGRDTIDGDFIAAIIKDHPLYQAPAGER
ncbi:MAG: AAA family ATPase [Deltaproteobacteria bacterium]|nr:AAA family ATPase [Deltaproteobacteria bacterium]